MSKQGLYRFFFGGVWLIGWLLTPPGGGLIEMSLFSVHSVLSGIRGHGLTVLLGDKIKTRDTGMGGRLLGKVFAL